MLLPYPPVTTSGLDTCPCSAQEATKRGLQGPFWIRFSIPPEGHGKRVFSPCRRVGSECDTRSYCSHIAASPRMKLLRAGTVLKDGSKLGFLCQHWLLHPFQDFLSSELKSCPYGFNWFVPDFYFYKNKRQSPTLRENTKRDMKIFYTSEKYWIY